MTLVKDTWAASREIRNGRTLDQVLAHLMTEVGELAQEIIIEEGRSYKPPGKDGVIGEALDVINCALDIIYIMDSMITEDEIREINAKKLTKWRELAGEMRDGRSN